MEQKAEQQIWQRIGIGVAAKAAGLICGISAIKVGPHWCKQHSCICLTLWARQHYRVKVATGMFMSLRGHGYAASSLGDGGCIYMCISMSIKASLKMCFSVDVH